MDKYNRNNEKRKGSQEIADRTPKHGNKLTSEFENVIQHRYEFKPRTQTQKIMAESIMNCDVTFGLGSAGTGKTHIAIALACKAYDEGKIKKIFLARPAVSTGTDLGALPGELEDKLAPFMRPLYDELEKVWGSAKARAKIASKEVEIVPVEMMRGRTLENAYFVLDEAQNCTIEQTDMALTRIGENTKAILTGDPSQCDLKKGASGFLRAAMILKGVEGISVIEFQPGDVVRSEIVKRIAKAFEKARAIEAATTEVEKQPKAKKASAAANNP